jgi:hypothetical protein
MGITGIHQAILIDYDISCQLVASSAAAIGTLTRITFTVVERVFTLIPYI